MKLVVQVKLLPTAEQAALLRSTLHACNNAADEVSRVAFETNVFREYPLRKPTYAELKARGLGAQAAQHVIKKVADAYTTLHANIRNGNLGPPMRRSRSMTVACRGGTTQARCRSGLSRAGSRTCGLQARRISSRRCVRIGGANRTWCCGRACGS